MSIKKLMVIGLVVVVGTMLFIGCAKPPTEKVNALQADLQNYEAQGAQVFAGEQYNVVSQKMSELQGLMDQKKYKDAASLADSIATDMGNLKSAIEANAQSMADQSIQAVNAELATFKGLLTPDTIKLLGEADAKTYQDQAANFETQAGALSTDMGNSAFLNVYNNATPLKDQITAASTELTGKVEAAKAAKAAPKAKGKKK